MIVSLVIDWCFCMSNWDYVNEAHQLFDEIPDKDLVSWILLISVFSRIGDAGSSLNAFYMMRNEDGMCLFEITVISSILVCGMVEGGYVHEFAGKIVLLSETKVLNSLVNMYGKYGLLNAP
ncbi:hypothetical protein QVD17_39256 [Tagetes erecta]|uniref:Pentatricopeptide repeat-containing protein n=1 Tax=Tagetes erecta TaxID=13708 RepID=A0AAD8JTP4_TARER|nr:hypothetical protein QVD17_39256 [Tagetes erecta]